MDPNKALTKDECYELLDRLGTGVLSLNGENGWPYSVPVNYIRIGDKVFFHGKKKGTKVSFIEKNGKCTLVAYDEKGYEDCGENSCDTTVVYDSVIIRGRAKVVEDDETKMMMLRTLVDKLVPAKKDNPIAPGRVPPTGVFAIEIDEITGKHHVPQMGHKVYPKN